MTKPQFLIETALLAHGISGISAEELLKTYPGFEVPFAWIDQERLS